MSDALTGSAATPSAASRLQLVTTDGGRPATADLLAVCCGLPLPRGAVPAGRGISLRDERGAEVAAQSAVQAAWPDGSAKWLLLDFAVPASARDPIYTVEAAGAQTLSAPLAHVGPDAVRLRSGDAEIVLDRTTGIRLERGGVPRARLRLELEAAGAVLPFVVEQLVVECNGPQRATVVMVGFARPGGARLNLAVRVTTCSSTPRVQCEVTLHNPRRAVHPGNFWELGDAGSLLLSRCALVVEPVPAAEGPGLPRLSVAEQPWEWRPATAPMSIYQESSGGPNWQSRVHVTRDGVVPMTRRGFLVEEAGQQREGLRAQPAVQVVAADDWSLAAALVNFWEEFPSAVVVSAEGTIALEMFPGAFPSPHELQGGERKTRTCVLAHGDGAAARRALDHGRVPVVGRALDARTSGVLPFLDAVEDPRHWQLISPAVDGEHSFAAKAERLDEYGWRHFGELVADHESAFLNDGAEPYVSHYNNQYDAVYGFGLQYLRTGDPRWWHLMDRLARHVRDIDIYHTVEDKAAYNGGLFWHTAHYTDAGTSTHRSYPRAKGISGGGPASEQNYNAGLALHFFLTGDPRSREAAIGLGRWVLEMDDGTRTPFRWLARGATGLASASGSELYHGPGRGAGNSILALLAAFELAGEPHYLHKAEQLICRCVHPEDDIAALDLLDAERRWYYTVFLEALGRYLWMKADRGERDRMYDYGRRALLHYARWMCAHEYPYLDKPEILEFPTETWSAQDLRKSDVLAWATWCERGAAREALLDGARRFFEDVLTRLPARPTRHFTRPVVLMLTRGYAYPWVASHPNAELPMPQTTAQHPSREPFTPQKQVALRRAKAIVVSGAAVLLVALAVLLFI